jgi:hypothetical protein
MGSFDTGFIRPRKESGGAPKLSGVQTATSSAVNGTTLELVPPFGQYDGVQAKVGISDADFVAASIKKDAVLFGLTGTYNEMVFTAGNNQQVVKLPTGSAGSTGSETYVSAAAITFAFAGTYRMTFEINTVNISHTAYGRIYNSTTSTYVGTERSTNSTTPVEFTEDITISAGTTLQLHVKIQVGGTGMAVQNYKAKTSQTTLFA